LTSSARTVLIWNAKWNEALICHDKPVGGMWPPVFVGPENGNGMRPPVPRSACQDMDIIRARLKVAEALAGAD